MRGSDPGIPGRRPIWRTLATTPIGRPNPPLRVELAEKSGYGATLRSPEIPATTSTVLPGSECEKTRSEPETERV